MLKTNSVIFKIIVVISLVLIVASIAVCIEGVVSENSRIWTRLCNVFALIAQVFAGYYILIGYSKNAAKHYKVFNALYALALLMTLVSIGVDVETGFPIFIEAASFALVMFMLGGRDLGKKVSFTVCILLMLLSVASIVLLLVTSGASADIREEAYGKIVIGGIAGRALLSFLFSVMTYAKYLDKKSRGAE